MELSDGRKTFDFLPDAVSIEEGESVVNGEIRLDFAKIIDFETVFLLNAFS